MARLIERHALNLGNGIGEQAGPLFITGSIVAALGLMGFALVWASSDGPRAGSVDFVVFLICSGALTLTGLILLVTAYFLNWSPTLYEELELYEDPVSATLRSCHVWFAGPKKRKPRRVLSERRFNREEITCVGYDLLIGGGETSVYYHRVVLALSGAGRKVIGEYHESQKNEAKRLVERITSATGLPLHQATADVYADSRVHHNGQAYLEAWNLRQGESFDGTSFRRREIVHVMVLLAWLLTVALVLYLVFG